MLLSTKEMNHGRSSLQKPNKENDNAKPAEPAKPVQSVEVFGAEGVVKFFR